MVGPPPSDPPNHQNHKTRKGKEPENKQKHESQPIHVSENLVLKTLVCMALISLIWLPGCFDFPVFPLVLIDFPVFVGFCSPAPPLGVRWKRRWGSEGAENQQKQENQSKPKEKQENQSPQAKKSTKSKPRVIFGRETLKNIRFSLFFLPKTSRGFDFVDFFVLGF